MKKTLLKNLALAVVGSFCVVGVANATLMLDDGLSMTGTYAPVDFSYETIAVRDATGISFGGYFINNPGKTNIHVYGLGLMRAEGFDNTPGVWNFTGQGVADADFSWSASAGTAPISEPATMLLFGAGLIGLAGIMRAGEKNRSKQCDIS